MCLQESHIPIPTPGVKTDSKSNAACAESLSCPRMKSRLSLAFPKSWVKLCGKNQYYCKVQAKESPTMKMYIFTITREVARLLPKQLAAKGMRTPHLTEPAPYYSWLKPEILRHPSTRP